ncbi:phage holin family protein [Patescibacteria group bacterium]|nr:phage holin family protein [Patescibacteria group bacterium]MBU1705741.1 phage holin family protein [Patescibacteria group bacterium]
MYIIFRWVINAVALLLIAYLVPGFAVLSFYSALIAALVLGLVNALVRPFLLIITFPITVVTLGLFIFVVNALMIWLVSTMVKGFEVSGFVPALLVALLLWAVSLATNWLIDRAKES